MTTPDADEMRRVVSRGTRVRWMDSGILSLFVGVATVLVGCEGTDGGSSPWETEARPPVKQGLYEVELKIQRDGCSEPSLAEIVEASPVWPPKTTGIHIQQTKGEKRADVKVHGYELRGGEDIPVGQTLSPGNRPTRRPLRKIPFDYGPACGSGEDALQRTQLTLRAQGGDRFELEMETTWKTPPEELEDCNFERRRRWLPDEYPCTERYTYTYERIRQCKPVAKCRMTNPIHGSREARVPPYSYERQRCEPRPPQQLDGEMVDPSTCDSSEVD